MLILFWLGVVVILMILFFVVFVLSFLSCSLSWLSSLWLCLVDGLYFVWIRIVTGKFVGIGYRG